MLKRILLSLFAVVFLGLTAQMQAQTCTGSLEVTITGSTSGSATAAPTGSAAQTFCQGATVANLVATGTSIKWYAAATGGTALESTTVLVNGTTYHATQTVVNGSTNCESQSRLAVTVTLDAATVGGTIAGGTTVCTGTNSTTLTLSGHTGSVVKWQSSSSSDFSSPTDITNTTTTLTATDLTATTYYRAVVQSGTCAAANSASATMTVDAATVGGTIAGGTTVCTGTNSTTLTLSGHTGSVVKWQSSSSSDFSSPTDITNTTTTLTATDLTATTYYRAVVQSGTCAAANSASATMTVDAATVGGTIAGGTTVCTGTNSTTLTLSGHTGSVVKWQSSSSSDFSSPTDITNTTTTLTATDLTATTYYRAVVQSGTCAAANSASATMTVDAATVGGTIAGGTTVCTGTNSTTLTLSGHTGSVVKWQSSSSSDFSSPTDITNTTTTLTATDLTATTYYRAVVQSGTCAAANSASATMTVDAATVGGTIAGGTTVCTGTNSTTLTLSGHTGSVVKWQSSSSSDFSSPTDITNTTTTLTATNLTATTYYRAVVQSGTCAAANSASATMTVTPLPTVADITGGTVVCGNTLQLSNATAGGTWSSSDETKATVSNAGLVTRVAVGTTTISYAVTQSGCTTTKTANIEVNPALTAGSCIPAHDACQLSEGQIRIEVTGGTTPYTLAATRKYTAPHPNSADAAQSITAPTGTESSGVTSYLFENLPGNATYKFRVTDNKGCIVGELHP